MKSEHIRRSNISILHSCLPWEVRNHRTIQAERDFMLKSIFQVTGKGASFSVCFFLQLCTVQYQKYQSGQRRKVLPLLQQKFMQEESFSATHSLPELDGSGKVQDCINSFSLEEEKPLWILTVCSMAAPVTFGVSVIVADHLQIQISSPSTDKRDVHTRALTCAITDCTIRRLLKSGKQVILVTESSLSACSFL